MLTTLTSPVRGLISQLLERDASRRITVADVRKGDWLVAEFVVGDLEARSSLPIHFESCIRSDIDDSA